MPRRKKVQLVYRSCPRCGVKVAGLTGPVHYTDAVFQRLRGVCDGCITPEERKLLTEPRSVRRAL